MRLKSIELAGFKSFVDPTRIEIGSGITSIVGPNGCGKSNIVDALRWVLGEHSARHLRGGVMDDLIFQGSETRPPVAVCDVELTFAVDKGQLPSPYHELEEIRIRRRLTREGGSDAFINGKMVRIKDVIDLFLDTGVSTRAYAIVEQGAIARMITARPEERRQVFEEAAGVMKYRSRRRETERKMNHTRQNLERAQDLLEEVRKQCRSLKQQASRAARFKSMQDEFCQLQSIYLGRRYQAGAAHAAEIAARLQQAEQQEQTHTLEMGKHEQAVLQARERLLQHEQQAQHVQDQLRAAEQQRAELQRQAERMAGEKRLLEERRTSIRTRLEESGRQLTQLQQEIEALQQKIAAQNDAELKQQQQQANADVEQARARYAAGQQRHRELLAVFERLRHAHETAAQQKEKAVAAIARLEQRGRQLEAQLQQNSEEQQQTEQQLQQAEQNRQQQQQHLETLKQQLAASSEKVESLRNHRQQLASALSEQERQTRGLGGMVQELIVRTENQDVPGDLRHMLRARGGIWMDEVLDVPEGLEAAVAAALRGRSADVRLPGDQQWRDILDSLSDTPVALYAGQPGGAVANSLAAAMHMPENHPLFDLFNAIALLENITEAAGATHCCVSRDGWRYEAGGWLIPPAGNRTARRLSLQRQLRRQQSQLRKAEQALEDMRHTLAQTEQDWQSQQQLWERLRLEVVEAESELQRSNADIQRLQQQLATLQQRRQQLHADLQAGADELQQWQQQQSENVEPNAAELEQHRQQLARQQQHLLELEQQLSQRQQQQAQADQALALFRQALDNLQRQLQRLHGEKQRLELQQKQDRQRLQQAEEQLAQLHRHDPLDTQLQQAEQAVEQAHQALNNIRVNGHDLQQALHECERQEREQRRRLQQLSDQRQAVAVELAQAQTRLHDLEEEIIQRCQQPVEQLLTMLENEAQTEDIEAIFNRCRELEDRLNRFGPVNLLAIEEFEQAAERESFLAEQAADLESSLQTLQETINRIDRTMRQRFQEVFEQTNSIFKKTFPRLFGGGKAELRLDSDDVLTAGVEVIAQPPGKRLQDVGLLSGGEKALTAVALVFSIFQIKPAPFCVLDEVDAPLDDANVDRFGAMIRELSDRVQFLAISHNKITMQHADRLIGVSMPEPGVSRIVGVELSSEN